MGLRRDVRGTFRNLIRSPGFAVAAILTFGLGIGVNLAVTAIIAAWRPAQRAANTDPATVLRAL